MTALLSGTKWAWPVGDHHQLIYAVAGQDAVAALAGLKNWLSCHDIDIAAFREQRLLFAAFARFGAALKDDPFNGRLTGLQRMLWTRAQMATRQNLPSVRMLEAVGIPVLFIKGAGMAALPYVSSRHRVSHDLDIVVHSSDFSNAFDLLNKEGWLPSSGQSRLSLQNHLPSLRSINLFRGHFGDIDLHSRPFHFSQGGTEQDDALWGRIRTGNLGGHPVHIPSAEDAIVLAIGHGGLDGHAHSDWLIDAARLVTNETVNWQLVLDIISGRGLAAASYLALAYLSQGLGISIPQPVVDELAKATKASPASYLSTLVQMRPRTRFSRSGQLLRGIVKANRMRADNALAPSPKQPARYLNSSTDRFANPADVAFGLVAEVNPVNQSLAGDVELELQIGPITTPRRIEFELNGETAHLARFMVRILRPRKNPSRIIVKGNIGAAPGGRITVESRPSRQLRELEPPQRIARYAAVPFALIRAGLK